MILELSFLMRVFKSEFFVCFNLSLDDVSMVSMSFSDMKRTNQVSYFFQEMTPYIIKVN